MKLYFSILMILIIIFLIFFLIKKYKLSRKQIIIFLILVLFWSSVSITRSYRKPFALDPKEIGGLALSVNLAVQIVSAYGLISFFIRLPLFLFSDYINRKKVFIQFAMLFMIVASLLVVFKPSYNTLYLSSISMGICASMLAIFNVIFSETFSKDKASVSASILSLAPLLAEFIAAPIQYLGTHGEYKNYIFLWTISSMCAILTLILTIYIPEFKVDKKELTSSKLYEVLKNPSFIFICIIALLQSFVKFSTSGTNMIQYYKSIGMIPLLQAYSDVIFSGFQLIASLLVGTYLTKKYRLERVLQLGILSSIIFFIISLLTTNQYLLFISYLFNGFGYGLIYISLISISLSYFDISYRNISMGIFQGFFSAGIFYGDSIYKYIQNNLGNGILGIEQSKSIFIIVLFVSIFSLILCNISLNVYKLKK